MKKRITVEQLRLGMYVVELDRLWTESRFLFQGFEIRTEEEIAELRRLCEHVYIQTDATCSECATGIRARTGIPWHSHALRGPTIPGVESTDAPPCEPRYPDRVSVEEELSKVRELQHEAKSLVHAIFEDARLGRSLDTGSAKRNVAAMVQSILRNPDALVCLNQLKHRDEYTAEHCIRVCVLALAFGRHLAFPEEELNVLGLGALLHDIGKARVPHEILNKPGKLTDAEFALIKSHVPYGVAMLEQLSGIPSAAIDVARFHHERFGGQGYALGLKEKEIGLFGQIGAIVDCYDALTSDRVYHKGISAHEALGKMYGWRHSDFDGSLVEQFIQCMGIYPIGSIVELNCGSVGVVVSLNRMRRLRPRIALVLDAQKHPCAPIRMIDLMHEASVGMEIRRVLPNGSYGISPVEYLPLVA